MPMNDTDLSDFIHSREIPLMEKIFSFKPAHRPGYLRPGREAVIANRVGNNLYGKRVPISKSIIQHKDMHPKEAIVNALVDNGIAPRSVDGWVDYVIYMVDSQGGWDVFCRDLENNLSYVESYESRVRLLVYNTILVTLWVVIFYLMMYSLFDIFMIPIFGVAVVLAYSISTYGFITSSVRKDRSAWIGRNKKPGELYTANSIKLYLNRN